MFVEITMVDFKKIFTFRHTHTHTRTSTYMHHLSEIRQQLLRPENAVGEAILKRRNGEDPFLQAERLPDPPSFPVT